jgi:integrase/recombinase XerD
LRSLNNTALSKTQSRTKVGHSLSVSQAARKLGVTAKTVLRWCESGTLLATEKSFGNKKSYEIHPQAVEVLLAQRLSEQEAKKALSASGKIVVSHEPHQNFQKAWITAMSTGLMTGKAFSHRTIEDYKYHIGLYFNRNDQVSLEGLKSALSKIPVHQIAKRQHLYKSVLSLAKFLVAEGVLDSQFLTDAKPLNPKRHLPPKRLTVTPEGMEKLLDACENSIETAMLVLLAHTGLRASEACALRLEDLDFKEGVIAVKCGKGGKSRKVGISKQLAEVLSAYLNEAHSSKATSGKYLFVDTKGKQMCRNGLYQRLERIGKKAGVPVSPHALRRAFVTIRANEGKPLQMLQRACGHSSITTTMSYCRTSETELINAMKDW